MVNSSLFGGATPHSPGEVATAGAEARNSPKRQGNKLSNICMLFEKANKCIYKYESPKGSSKGCKRLPEQVSRAHYQGSQGDKLSTSDLAGARVHNQPKDIREHTTSFRPPTLQPTGVRDHTFTEIIGRGQSIFCSGLPHSTPSSSWGESTSDPVNPERHTSNGRDHLSVQSDICRQNQPIQAELEGPNSGDLGNSDSDGRLSNTTHFYSQPTLPSIQPHLSPEDTAIMEEEIQSLLQKQAISQIPTAIKGFYSNMFIVPKKDGGQRPVINLKQLNRYVKSEHFKMEGLHTVKALLRKHDWMAKVDLKDAFFMVPVAPQFRQYLLFKLGKRIFQFNCLPFGLCTAPRVFTKILKPAVEMLRSLSIRLVIYMDDMLLMADSKQKLAEHIQSTLFLLKNLGFIVNSKKSILQPTQEIEFLGMIVSSLSMDLKLPGEKIRKIRQEARHLLQLKQPSAHLLSQFLGKLNATSPALQMAPLFCRSLQICLKQALTDNQQNYQAAVQLSPQALEDLQWWELHLSSWNGRSLIIQSTSLTITSDASLQGWGATCNGNRTKGPWSPHEQSLHINCLELLAATLAVQTFAKGKSGIFILLQIDNSTAVAYINRRGGTVSPKLSQLAKDLWLWCMERNILLHAQHLPGILNTIVDEESRTWSDRSEWKLSPILFQEINRLLGPLSTDLFASRLSSQLPVFVSWKPDPLAVATDAFTQDWNSLPGKLYANPPWGLIGRVLSLVHTQGVQELVLVAPVWKAQPWYPMLLQMLVRAPILIPQSPDTIQPVCQNNLPDIIPQLAVWAISANSVKAATFLKQLQILSSHHGGTDRQSHTIPHLGNGLAGVLDGIEIHFQDL